MNKKNAGIRNCIFIEDAIGRKPDGKIGPNTLKQFQEELKICKVKENVDEAGIVYWTCGNCKAVWYNKDFLYCPNCGRKIIKGEG